MVFAFFFKKKSQVVRRDKLAKNKQTKKNTVNS